ncbi:hypothetical protein NE237_023836 [Protea cynaroides]|uniref:Uncharacterized protein n=1 Tax=Protea cynaroides TaxID=273540 RepID=A0A9Q0HH01_9MAGN|nr:hypothetical protein NE237_023836 [Protea cynaroides]
MASADNNMLLAIGAGVVGRGRGYGRGVGALPVSDRDTASLNDAGMVGNQGNMDWIAESTRMGLQSGFVMHIPWPESLIGLILWRCQHRMCRVYQVDQVWWWGDALRILVSTHVGSLSPAREQGMSVSSTRDASSSDGQLVDLAQPVKGDHSHGDTTRHSFGKLLGPWADVSEREENAFDEEEGEIMKKAEATIETPLEEAALKHNDVATITLSTQVMEKVSKVSIVMNNFEIDRNLLVVDSPQTGATVSV